MSNHVKEQRLLSSLFVLQTDIDVRWIKTIKKYNINSSLVFRQCFFLSQSVTLIILYSRCDLGQAHCNDTDIHQKMEGPCDGSAPLTTPGSVATNMTGSPDIIDHSTTPAPESVVHGSEVRTYCLLLKGPLFSAH